MDLSMDAILREVRRETTYLVYDEKLKEEFKLYVDSWNMGEEEEFTVINSKGQDVQGTQRGLIISHYIKNKTRGMI